MRCAATPKSRNCSLTRHTYTSNSPSASTSSSRASTKFTDDRRSLPSPHACHAGDVGHSPSSWRPAVRRVEPSPAPHQALRPTTPVQPCPVRRQAPAPPRCVPSAPERGRHRGEDLPGNRGDRTVGIRFRKQDVALRPRETGKSEAPMTALRIFGIPRWSVSCWAIAFSSATAVPRIRPNHAHPLRCAVGVPARTRHCESTAPPLVTSASARTAQTTHSDLFRQ